MLVTGTGIDGIIELCAAEMGFGMVSLVITLVGDTSEFITMFGSTIVSTPVTLLHTSASACSCDVFTSGTLTALELDTVVVVVVVRLMHVLMDGNIGITGITTEIHETEALASALVVIVWRASAYL